MIAVDSNVLIRHFLTEAGTTAQVRHARDLIEEALEQGEGVFISEIVICECIWVFRRAFKLPKKSLLIFLDSVLNDAPFVVEDERLIHAAKRQFARTGADFADCLIAATAKVVGCRTTYTFDRNARAVPGMAILGDPTEN